MMVVDPNQLTAVAGQFDEVKISMADPDSIDRYRDLLFDVGKAQAVKYFESLLKQKNIELNDLRQNKLQNKNKITLLEQELAQLEGQRNKIEDQARELVDRYAPVNLDDASNLFKDAFQLFQQGKLDSAILLLNKADLRKQVANIKEEVKRINNVSNEIDIRKSTVKQKSQNTSQAIELEAYSYKTHFEFDSASAYYELLISLDSLNTKNLIVYGKFLEWLNQHDKAIRYFTMALEILQNNVKNNIPVDEQNMAIVQAGLGICYTNKNIYVKADTALSTALEICRRLAKEDPEKFEPFVA